MGIRYTTFDYTLLDAPTVVHMAPLTALLASDTSRTFFKKDPTNPLVSYVAWQTPPTRSCRT